MIASFIGGIGIILIKIWNIMVEGNFYSNFFKYDKQEYISDIKISMMLFIIIAILHFVTFVIFMQQPERSIFKVFFLLFNAMNGFNLIITIGEVFYSIAKMPQNVSYQAYSRKVAK
jgi:hypothetical protein